jgi:hypothetical protein
MMDGKGADYGFDEEKRRAEPIDAFLTARWKLEKISIFWIWSAVFFFFLNIYIYIYIYVYIYIYIYVYIYMYIYICIYILFPHCLCNFFMVFYIKNNF